MHRLRPDPWGQDHQRELGGAGRSRSLQLAIQRAQSAGILFVAAAGNDATNIDTTPGYPASFTSDNILSVAATTRSDAWADYSNYGAVAVDLAAPGSEIYSTWFTSDDAYVAASGTSMAAPFVSGTLALLAANFPNATYSTLRAAVLESADPIPALASRTATGGRLNAYGAFRKLLASSSSPPQLAVSRTPGGGVTVVVKAEANSRFTLRITSNLSDWTTVGTLTTDATGEASLEVALAPDASRFFRAVRE